MHPPASTVTAQALELLPFRLNIRNGVFRHCVESGQRIDQVFRRTNDVEAGALIPLAFVELPVIRGDFLRVTTEGLIGLVGGGLGALVASCQI